MNRHEKLLSRICIWLLLLLGAMANAQSVEETSDADKLRELIDQGQYAKVISIGQQEELDRQQSLALADAYIATGDAQQARELLRTIISVSDPVSSIARVRLGRMEVESGSRREGLRMFTQAFDHYQQNLDDYSTLETIAAADAVAELARIDPSLTEIALDIYEQAVAFEPENPRTNTAIGDYLLSRYNSAEAMQAYSEALGHDAGFIPALYGVARTHHFDRNNSKARESLAFLLEVQPNYVPARLLVARLAIDDDDFEVAEQAITTALETQPGSAAALSLSAAIHYLRDERTEFEAISKRIRTESPGYVDLYLTLAEIAAQHRRYFDAVEFSNIAVNLHPRAWRAHALLGINRLRIGDMNRGRFNLERAFQGNPFDIWTKNTLDLLDHLDTFQNLESDRFILAADSEEAEVLAPYLLPLAERAFDYYEKKYSHTPETPIRIEVYPDHKDFSVRTVGLVGVDIVGVSFGPVVAFDSPSSRVFGDFNWASVLWHEIAHSFHIDMSKGKVPRWFTEGLSVFEERLGGVGWGNDISDSFLTAYNDGKLVPASDLDQAFMRPTYAEQVPHAYYQASLIMDMIEKKHGFDAIVNMLRGFGSGATTQQMIRDILGTEAADFDKEFDEYLKTRFEGQLAAIKPTVSGDLETSEYYQLMQTAASAVSEDDLVLAEQKLLEAQKLFPDRAGAGSSYRELANLYRRRDDNELAIAQLVSNIDIDADDLDAHLQLADLYQRNGDQQAVARILQRVLYIQPFDASVHQRLGQYFADNGEWDEALNSRAATMALEPADAVEARYLYAQALENTGQRQQARQQLLRTLEVAPLYDEALDLLLNMNTTDATDETKPAEEKSE